MSTPYAPLYVQIQDFVREGIRSQRFKSGDRLPSETEIARRFATTRATVARALQQLTYEGLISRRVGSGTYVGGDGGYIDAVAMDAVQGHEQRLAAAGEKLSYKLLAWEEDVASEQAAARLRLDIGAPVWRLERLRSAGGSAVAQENRIVPAATALLIDAQWLREHPIQEVLTRLLGIRIGRIENLVRSASAGTRMARLFDCPRTEPLLVREHVIYDAKGLPILCGETSYRSGFSIMYTQKAAALRP